MMSETLHVFIAAVGSITGAGILAGILWLAKLGIEKLFGSFLERKLSAFKHEQNEKVEKLKNALGYISDRGVRSNELEYQALIAAWEGFIEAYNATFGAIGGFRQRPDFSRMTDDEITKWLDTTSISQLNKDYILKSTDRFAALGRIERMGELNDCQNAIWKAQQVIRHKSVFIPADIEEQFDQALITLRHVWSENKVNHDMPGSVPIDKTISFMEGEEKKGGMRDKLRDTVRSRVLHDLTRRDLE